MPEEATVEDIEQIHIDAWKMGLKAVAIYRDNCKVAQPLSMAKKDSDKIAEPVTNSVEPAGVAVTRGATRRDLPKIRNSKTFKFTVGGVRGYAIVGEYDDGTPGELFISSSKMGSTLRGVMDAFGTSVSYGLQFGVPLKNYVVNFTHTSFAPSGITDDPEIRTASSIIDYIFKRLGKTYLNFDDQLEVGLAQIEDMPEGQTSLLDDALPAAAPIQPEATPTPKPIDASVTPEPQSAASAATAGDSVSQSKTYRDESAPLCFNCGNQTQRSGSCYVCTSCGSTTGCS
jgi:ribonucleoside-diphosphate reductase alpha chain